MPLYNSFDNGGIKEVVRQDVVARPSTPSFRIVATPAVNPSPTFTEEFEEEEVLFEDVLSPKKLRQLTGFSDLSQVISMDLLVDTSESSLGSLGNYLPNILELRLSGSRISSVRDLGTTLRSLQVLWMSQCGLEDLDGIASIGQLKELYLSYNEISDVSPLSMIDTLELVDIESNNMQTLEQVEFLCMCPRLRTLNLEGNPLTATMSPSELRTKISDILPNLLYLDDQPLKGQPVSELATSSHKLLGNTGNLQSEIRVVNTSLKDSMTEVLRRPRSARSEDSMNTTSPTPQAVPIDHSSELTQGSVACGPASKLRSKVSKSMKESEPPKLVGAWSDDADDMVREWQASRDWLTRELTVDNINEEKMKEEKQANYEAALRDVSRPSTAGRKLSRPTSSRCSSFSQSVSPVQQSAEGSKTVNKTPTYDESFEVNDASFVDSPGKSKVLDLKRGDDGQRFSRKSRDGSRDATRKPRDSSRDTGRKPRDNSRDIGRKPRDNSRDIGRKPRDNSRDTGRKPRDESRDIERKPRDSSHGRYSKGKEKLVKAYSTSTSSEFPKRRTPEINSPTSISLESPTRLTPTSPIRGVISPSSDKRALPTPPSSGKSMSTRFRRLKVSIEDQVAQQSAVDVLFSDRMPKPGLSRHTMAVSKQGDCG